MLRRPIIENNNTNKRDNKIDGVFLFIAPFWVSSVSRLCNEVQKTTNSTHFRARWTCLISILKMKRRPLKFPRRGENVKCTDKIFKFYYMEKNCQFEYLHNLPTSYP